MQIEMANEAIDQAYKTISNNLLETKLNYHANTFETKQQT